MFDKKWEPKAHSKTWGGTEYLHYLFITVFNVWKKYGIKIFQDKENWCDCETDCNHKPIQSINRYYVIMTMMLFKYYTYRQLWVKCDYNILLRDVVLYLDSIRLIV